MATYTLKNENESIFIPNLSKTEGEKAKEELKKLFGENTFLQLEENVEIPEYFQSISEDDFQNSIFW